MKRFELKCGDLLMSCSGTMGKIAIVPQNIKRGIINQALLKITPNENVILKEYLKLIIGSDYFQKLLIGLSSGAAQVNVPSVKILKNIIMPVPNINTQKEILKKHSIHHSKKHMKEMKTAMNKGTSFTKSHKAAMKKVGT